MRRPHVGLRAALLRRYPLSPWLHLFPTKPAEQAAVPTRVSPPQTTHAA
ncbi:hypothetical protein ACTHQY_05060 [Rhodococcoides corynebacterioides]